MPAEGEIKIKICGVTLPDDAARVAAAGVDFIGLNFWAGSKRRVEVERAAELAAAIRGAGPARIVGVFVDARPIEIATAVARVNLDVLQLHGAESPGFAATLAADSRRPVWKAIAAGAAGDLDQLEAWDAGIDAILLDAPAPGKGGGGVPFDWELARAARVRHPSRRFLLAGGLTPDNVAVAVAAVRPWAVDVASGVESSPGVKDPGKVAAFVAAARGGR